MNVERAKAKLQAGEDQAIAKVRESMRLLGRAGCARLLLMLRELQDSPAGLLEDLARDCRRGDGPALALAEMLGTLAAMGMAVGMRGLAEEDLEKRR